MLVASVCALALAGNSAYAFGPWDTLKGCAARVMQGTKNTDVMRSGLEECVEATREDYQAWCGPWYTVRADFAEDPHEFACVAVRGINPNGYTGEPNPTDGCPSTEYSISAELWADGVVSLDAPCAVPWLAP